MEQNATTHIIKTNYKMDLNEKFPFSKNNPELAFEWTEQEREYAEDGFLCNDVESLSKQVFFFFFLF